LNRILGCAQQIDAPFPGKKSTGDAL
jgi:hypothetical protein